MQLRIFTEPQQGASYDDLLAVASAAEELGFDAFFRSDHYLAFSGDGLPGPTDAWITLAGLARDTSRIRLGTLVSPVTFRQPGPLALSVAQVDVMSGGRVELGLGAGWNEREHRAYGLDWPESFTERFSMLEEQLEVVTGMWATAEGETFSYSGKKYALDSSPALPKPAQRPGPPIVIGGGGAKRTPTLAARFGAEYNTPFLSPAAAGEAFGRVRAACEAIGRDPVTITLSSASTVCCGADEAEVERRATAIGRNADQARKGGVGGTPDEVIAKLNRYGGAGAQRVYLQVLDLKDLDHLRLLAQEVMPHVA
ncbi:MAG: LLM class F420-dependent oxidoreductase [Actinobacteria bacterium]|nr:LLM class F420-dependent oxidoreductase [Actinomycetota bacterium]